MAQAPALLKGPFTVESFQRLGALGVLREDERVELVGGQVVAMTPIGQRHAACVRRFNRLFARSLGDRAIIDVQNPAVLGPRDAPQPDVVLLAPRPDGYRTHPRAADILLIVEVADTTIAYDRDIKIPLYAHAMIPEAWIVDLGAGVIHTYRDPSPRGYATARVVARSESLEPLRFAGIALPAQEVLD